MKGWWLVLVVLGGCPAATPTSSTMPPPAASAEGGPPVAAAAPDGDGRVAMPDLTGKTEDEAKAALRAAGIVSEPEANTSALECENAAHDEGKINCQDPEPGKRVDPRGIVRVTVYHGNAGSFAGVLRRAQLEPLVGLTIAQAKAQLAKLGHDGEVRIEPATVFSKKCGVDKVCAVEPSSGTGIHDPVTLVVNPKPDIAMPPD